MKIKNIALFLLSAIYLTACGAVTPIPATGISTLPPATKTSTPNPVMTATTKPTLFYGWTPTPETVSGYPTALMPVEADPFAKNVPLVPHELSLRQLYIGKYIVRNWCKDDDTIRSYCSITISTLGNEQVEIWGFPVYLGAETGADLTGTGIPDIVVISSQGNPGAIITVFEAGDTLKEIMNIWTSADAGGFVDLNNDGSYEYIASDRRWSQFSNCGATNLPLVYEFNNNFGYVNQTSKYKEVILPNIQWGINHLSAFKLENPNTEVPLCDVYYLVTAYLVSGQQEKAWAILDENYPAEKAAEYKAGFLEDLGDLVP